MICFANISDGKGGGGGGGGPVGGFSCVGGVLATGGSSETTDEDLWCTFLLDFFLLLKLVE